MYVIVRKLSGFRWSAANAKIAVMLTPLVAAVFVSQKILPPLAAGIFGAVTAVSVGILSMRTLCTLVPLQKLPRLAQKLLVFFRMVPLDTNA
jgi:hypothetical protein